METTIRWPESIRLFLVGRPLRLPPRKATMEFTQGGGPRALIGPSHEPAPDTVRFPALYPRVWHLQSCLSADERGAGVHATAGPAADRRLHAATLPGPGLPLIAASMPQTWPVRFIDENVRKATEADFAWADAVLVSGMHVQAPQIHDIPSRAHAAGKVVMLGGPSASASPEMYADIDYLHIGEMGDATDA